MTPPALLSPPPRLILCLAAVVSLTALLNGCALLRRRPHPAALQAPQAATVGQPISAISHPGEITAEGRVGTVRMIGRGGRFVLVETLNGGTLALPDGQELHCRANAEPGAPPTANLRLSRERRLQFSTADVVDGQPNVGDAVFVGGPAMAPSATPGSIIAPGLLPVGAGGMLPPPAAGGRP